MRRLALVAAAIALSVGGPAHAWGFEGHEVIARIARAELKSTIRAKVDAILAQDQDRLTAHDMAAEATWADAYRSAGHRETAQWHFVDNELDHPDLTSACFGNPPAAQPASAGPAQDCVVDKVREFAAELSVPATNPAERLLALKYLLHLVGDLHQPLHASDNHDRGGNCVLISLGDARAMNLHAYWDTAVVQALGTDPVAVAGTLHARITPQQRATWRRGDAAAWAKQALQVARTTAYKIDSPPGCPSNQSSIALPNGYDVAAQAAATVQLERAGVRLALVLNRALANISLASTDSAIFSKPASRRVLLRSALV